MIDLRCGDCLEVMPTLLPDSIDSIVADPPYGLKFMNKNWDHGVPGVPFWEAALRVAKPGAFLLAFGGTRTHHRLMVAIEDAGWEIRDCLMWLYGSGFPKSLDIGKAIDKAAGAEREVIGPNPYNTRRPNAPISDRYQQAGWPSDITAPATDAARQWDGWGTALKPAWEPIIMARKPLSEPTVAANVLAHGVGGLNIDASRVNTDGEGGTRLGGRWPSNLLLDDAAAELLDEQSGTSKSKVRPPTGRDDRGVPGFVMRRADTQERGHDDAGGASRFFYCAKASKRDRDEGLEGMEERDSMKWSGGSEKMQGLAGKYPDGSPRPPQHARNHHPTVKPTALCRWLVRLVTPPGGTVLDPFMGSGSTGVAAKLEGFNFVGIELNLEYVEIARRRIGD